MLKLYAKYVCYMFLIISIAIISGKYLRFYIKNIQKKIILNFKKVKNF